MRHVKAWGLAAIAALALLAVPSLASASGGIEADTYTATYKGTGATQYFAIEGVQPTECNEAGLSGTAKGPVSTLSTSVAMKCGGKALNMGSCKLELHPGSENTVDIGPAGCGPITGLFISSCEISIPAQTGLPATFTNELVGGKEVVQMKIWTTVQATKKGCPFTNPVVYQGEWEIKGYNQAMEQVNIRTRDSFNGFFVAGEKSEDPAKQPKFTAEKYPNPVSGALASGSSVTFNFPGAGKVVCSVGTFSAVVTQATTSLPIGASLSGCLYEKQAATVVMHSCSFNYSVSNTVFPAVLYSGKVGISCSKEGDSIELLFNGCTATISAQTPGTSSAAYVNEGTGGARVVRVSSGSAGKLGYSYTSGGCTILGKNHSDGTLSVGSFTLRGL